MRVLLLGPYPPPYGGVEVNLAAIQGFLVKRGVPCDVINLTRYRKREADGIYYPRNAMQVFRLLFRLRSEVIHLHIGGDVTWRLLWLGCACSLLRGRKVVLTLHSGGYPRSDAGRKARAMSLRGFLFRRFDGLIAVNPEIVDLFQRFGVAPERIRLIPPHALPAGPPDVGLPEWIEKFVRTHRPLLITISGLEPEYDLPLQIDLLGELRKSYPEAGLVIFGKGSLEQEIRQAIGTRDCAPHVLLGGDVPRPVLLRVLFESDMFLRTTHYDGDSIAVREALHFGVPAIATDNGMRPPGTRLVPHSDGEALRRESERCLAEPRVRPTRVEADEGNLEAVYKYYQELLGEDESKPLGERLRITA